MRLAERIEINPDICFGKPVISGTRIPVAMVLDLLGNGLSPEAIIADWYPHLHCDDILACIRYANSLVQNEDIHPVAV